MCVCVCVCVSVSEVMTHYTLLFLLIHDNTHWPLQWYPWQHTHTGHSSGIHGNTQTGHNSGIHDNTHTGHTSGNGNGLHYNMANTIHCRCLHRNKHSGLHGNKHNSSGLHGNTHSLTRLCQMVRNVKGMKVGGPVIYNLKCAIHIL